ncbi:hypothetical protein [Halosolutus halophilus]|uniref:hypothetical protein n=1 Tax=Halosolutus halophilus TaxID=1552990 RepID=UPI0022352B33|nr:hypothetical protein [Halosolutus halophilus]
MVPLQFGFPGGIELLVLFGIFLVVPVVLGFVLAYWVYTDADGRGDENAALWALAVGVLLITTFFGGLLAFAVYIWQRE